MTLKDYFTAGKMNFYEKLNIYIVEMSNYLRKIFYVIQEQGEFLRTWNNSYNIQVPQSIASAVSHSRH